MVKNKVKPIGLTKAVGFQIGVRRTFPINLQQAWKLISSKSGLSIWLDSDIDFAFEKDLKFQLANGCQGEVRIFKPHSHLRLAWKPKDWEKASTIQIRVIPVENKTVIAFHQENLADSGEREKRQKFFNSVLDRFEMIIKSKKNKG